MDIATPSYLCLKSSTARKTGQHAEGGITYAVLKDVQSSGLFFTLTANDGGGYFSREVIPFQRITDCIAGIKANQPLPAKVFRSAFVGKSSNNAGFLVAALRHEGLLAAARDASQQHVLAGDWSSWTTAMLKLTGEPYQLPQSSEAGAPVVPVDDSGKTSTQNRSIEDQASPRKSKKPRKTGAAATTDASPSSSDLDEGTSSNNPEELSHAGPA